MPIIDNINVDKIIDDLEFEIINKMEIACALVEGRAKALAPVDTGRMRDSTTHEVVRDGDEIIGRIGSNVNYSVWVEFGTGEFAENGQGRQGGWGYEDEEGIYHQTKGNKPHPFLRPALKDSEEEIKEIFRSE